MTNTDSLRVKALKFLEQLKDGITVKYDNTEIEYVFDPSADYDLVVRRINNTIIMNIYSRNARCTVSATIDKNGEWRLRRVTCRR
jgi:CRISPR/Cas system endoribonuclease Cas6 (RAMP superfamily)